MTLPEYTDGVLELYRIARRYFKGLSRRKAPRNINERIWYREHFRIRYNKGKTGSSQR